MIFLYFIVTFLFVYLFESTAFNFNSKFLCETVRRNSVVTMKWSIGKRKGAGGPGNGADTKFIGAEGELYYHPSKVAKLTGVSADTIGKQRAIPILPYNNNLAPYGTEWVHVFEMRYRQMMQDVGNGVFGFTYYSQTEQKLALVGTLARVKTRKFLDDGRLYVSIEGISRFYINEVVSEAPYLKAKVTPFSDTAETGPGLDLLERIVFDEVRINVKLMQIVFPQKNFSISDNILESRPLTDLPGVRSIVLSDPKTNYERRVRFSFAVLDMLQTSPATKLAILQEHNLEKRYARLITVLEKGGTYLRSELRSKDIMTDDDLRRLRDDTLSNSDFIPKVNWNPENYVNGNWIQSVTRY